MAFQFNLAYRSTFTSKGLNDKIHLLLGNNVLLNGFQVTPGSSGAVSMSPGAGVIKGCIITEDTQSYSLTLPTSNIAGGETYVVYLEYTPATDLAVAQCSFKYALSSATLADNTLVVASVFRPYNTVNVVTGNITMKPYFKPLSQISADIEVMLTQFAGGSVAYGTVQPQTGWWFQIIG